ncbi:zf-HC2 domain-containing protein [Nocardiopsis suaedae]|uniref:Zf-HC2 domain-containing protein n=1 Tax=Nocardiopsis suaedae TaxID=3018444 RepID=A0ABT4TUN5_9ACTN|nr:zf-HC2 domain-containing protein [Nocardiopsis suaedae]MDA2808418.1 zf-HC2 domain-containing protein [Nocardiopsis suaedae]
MSTEHLGERLSALVDGELGAAERDRALIHLASCDACRFEADLLRRLKRRLHGLDGPEPAADLLGRLSALGSAAGEPPQGPPPGAGGGPRPFGGSAPLGSGPALGDGPGLGERPGFGAADAGGPAARRRSQASALRAAAAFLPFRSSSEDRRELEAAERRPRPRPVRQRRRTPRYAMAGASLVAVALGGAFVAGGEEAPGPVVRPPLPDYALEHALTAGEAALPSGQDERRAGGGDRGAVPALHDPKGGAEGAEGSGGADGSGSAEGSGGAEGSGSADGSGGAEGTGRDDRGDRGRGGQDRDGQDRDGRSGDGDGGDIRTDTPRAW